METNYEHYYSTPEKLVERAGCTCDCYICIYPPTIPCNCEFTSTPETLLEWLNSEYDENAKPHKGKFSL